MCKGKYESVGRAVRLVSAGMKTLDLDCCRCPRPFVLGDKVIQEVVGINTVVEDGDELALEEHVKSIRCYHEDCHVGGGWDGAGTKTLDLDCCRCPSPFVLGEKVIQEVVGINTVVEDGDELALEEHVKSIRCYHEDCYVRLRKAMS